MKKFYQNKLAGFTLVEVMVAVTLVAVGIGGLSQGLSQYVRNFGIVKNRLTMQNIAWNKLSEAINKQRSGGRLVLNGTEQVGNISFSWQIEEVSTEVRNIKRFDAYVDSSDGKKRILSTMLIK